MVDTTVYQKNSQLVWNLSPNLYVAKQGVKSAL